MLRLLRRLAGQPSAFDSWLDVQPTTELVTTVYVTTDLDPTEIAKHLADHVRGTLTRESTTTGAYELDVVDNDDRPQGEVDPADELLFYPYQLELEWHDRDGPTTERVEAVVSIMNALDHIGAQYVTAADFEADLPRGGRSAPS